MDRLALTCFLSFFAVSVYTLPSPRIVDGRTANITDYPYQVSILIDGEHACGGSIITEKFILSAAHCFEAVAASNLKVRAASSLHATGGQVVNVLAIYIHPNFSSDNFANDIAVLELSTKINLGTHAAKIVMIAANGSLPEGALAAATGWGRLSYEGEIPKQLQVVSLPVIGTTTCRDKYYGGQLLDTMFCAGYDQGGKDTCQGDSGGPLVYNKILIGITSAGDVCGLPKSPGVFTKLSELRYFVDSIIK